MKPIHVHFFDNDGFVIYNLTQEQFDRLREADDWDTIDKFAIAPATPFDNGYANADFLLLAKLLDFTVSSE